MKVIKAKYQENSNWVTLTLENGRIVQVSINDEIKREYTDLYMEFLKNGGVVEPYKTKEELLEESKFSKISELKSTYSSSSNSSIEYKGIKYKGGEASASAIAGAVNLAQNLKELDVTIIDASDKENTLSFSDALELSALIAKSWRDEFFKYKELKRAVLAAQSVEELELIKW